MNHYDARAPYSFELGNALAEQWDTYALRVGVLAARASATITGGKAGVVITDADAATNGLSLLESIVTAARRLDEANLPKAERYAFVSPELYYKLLLDATNNPALINLDKDVGGDGSLAKGVVGTIAGIKIVPTNLLPSTNIASAVTGAVNTYHGNFTTTKALVMHKSAIGAVMLKDVMIRGEDDIARLGYSMVASMVSGIGILRPEAAVEIKTS